MAMSIVEQCKHFESTISIFEQYTLYLEKSILNRQQATELPVTDSDFVLKSSNKLTTGILNGYEHCGAVQTFLNQPWAYLNSTNFI